MHVLHIVAVEASSAAEATATAEELAPDWSDWSTVGGRWDGVLNGSNTLQVSADPTRARTALANMAAAADAAWREHCTALTGSLDENWTAPAAVFGLPVTDPDAYRARLQDSVAETGAEWSAMLASASLADVPPFSMASWHARKVADLASRCWCSDSAFYDAINWEADPYRLMAAIDEETVSDTVWLVAVDLHY